MKITTRLTLIAITSGFIAILLAGYLGYTAVKPGESGLSVVEIVQQ